jgi:predicted dehydrogenase
MNQVKMGYVGCGFMAQKVHIPNLISLPECEFVAVAELREKLAKKVQERHRIPKLYKDHRELASDPEIEAVGVSGHFAVQGEIAIDLLRAGKHVFMEKPMAVSVSQAERILDAVRESGCRLMVGYMKRYDAGNELVKDKLDQFIKTGELGRITYVRNHGFCGDWIAGLDTPLEQTDEPYPAPEPLAGKPDWLPDQFYRGYIGYLQQYTHNVNLLRWFLDAYDKVRVECVHLDDNGMNGVVILNVNGMRAIIESGSVAYHGWDEHTQIYFQKGWIKTCAPPLLLKNVPASVEIYRSEPSRQLQNLIPASGWSWAYKREAEHFLRCVIEDAPFRSPAEDTINDVRVFEDIYRMFAEKRESNA